MGDKERENDRNLMESYMKSEKMKYESDYKCANSNISLKIVLTNSFFWYHYCLLVKFIPRMKQLAKYS